MQFGMLIEYLFEKFPDTESVTETAIGDLQVSVLSRFRGNMLLCDELKQFSY